MKKIYKILIIYFYLISVSKLRLEYKFLIIFLMLFDSTAFS